MLEKLQSIRERALERLNQAADTGALEQIRVAVLGKKGELTALLRSMGQLAPEERPAMGQKVNELRALIEEKLAERERALKEREKEARLQKEAIDVTLPVEPRTSGAMHPCSIVLDQLLTIFTGMGFEVVEGPEVEYDHYNFELLNLPKNHPARDAQDTFYIDDNIVLRTHTSPVQARIMTTRKPPIRIVCPGRTYRVDEADATHSPVFQQIEGLVIDEGISMSDLKGTGWIEVLGAGMVNPKVLEMCGIDPGKYTGFAFGIGIERITMLKYGVPNMKYLWENDVRFLKQFR